VRSEHLGDLLRNFVLAKICTLVERTGTTQKTVHYFWIKVEVQRRLVVQLLTPKRTLKYYRVSFECPKKHVQ
jgi:hypothetical protein